MSILNELKQRFRAALAERVDDPDAMLDLVRRSQDPRFGDYQANFAMPLGKRLKRPPREIAEEICKQVDLSDLCELPEIAGPGFINLKLLDDQIVERLHRASANEQLGIDPVELPRTFVVDFSAPNVAKPMHVGHIRSTVIGDALCRILRFVGHQVISDNHLGDWGTQFGMILYGFRNFLDEAAYRENPVLELARLYRLVRQQTDYHETRASIGPFERKLAQQESDLQQKQAEAGEKPDKKTAKAIRRLTASLDESRKELQAKKDLLADAENNPTLAKLLVEHPEIAKQVGIETAKLHAGDEENLRLWREFLPDCRDEIDRVYARLGVSFDQTLGESFYNDRLAPLVDELLESEIVTESDGAICMFFDGDEVPMLIRKRDGAFLYATTDLATLRYRIETWHPDAILYVVDFRQSMHFKHLFAAASRMNIDIELRHVQFGTVMGSDNRPFKTRSGDTIGLEGLLDEAVRRAALVVAENDDAKPDGPELSPDDRARIAETVGIGALKYADLSQNRESDYVFSYDKMLAMTGNTGTYAQYAFARVRSIFRRGNIDTTELRASAPPILLTTEPERALALELLRFGEALDLTMADFRPNQLTTYLFELANHYSTFFQNCPVLKAETEPLRQSRLLLCDLTARTIQKCLELLGLAVVEKM